MGKALEMDRASLSGLIKILSRPKTWRQLEVPDGNERHVKCFGFLEPARSFELCSSVRRGKHKKRRLVDLVFRENFCFVSKPPEGQWFNWLIYWSDAVEEKVKV